MWTDPGRAGATPSPAEMAPDRRVALVLSSLAGPGGAERSALIMAAGLRDRGWDPTVVTLDEPGAASFFAVPPGVRWIAVGERGPSRNLLAALIANARRLRTLRQTLSGLGLRTAISFIDQMNVVTILATRRTGIAVIAAERNDPRRHRIGRTWTFLRRIAYRWAAAVVTQSADARAAFEPAIRRRTVVIPNAVAKPPGKPPAPARSTDTAGSIVGMGRLSEEKGFDVLLEAYASIARANPGWSLTIHGEGPQRGNLVKRVAQLGLGDRVSLPGVTTDSDSAISAADIFVLSSRHEGFPMVLCEAMARGRPVIATAISGGTRDVVRPGIDAVVVPPDDAVALAAALEGLIGDPAGAKRLGRRAMEVVGRFDVGAVLDRWEALLVGASELGD